MDTIRAAMLELRACSPNRCPSAIFKFVEQNLGPPSLGYADARDDDFDDYFD
jgi:hypothetical protein